jgi:hypothetical protein
MAKLTDLPTSTTDLPWVVLEAGADGQSLIVQCLCAVRGVGRPRVLVRESARSIAIRVEQPVLRDGVDRRRLGVAFTRNGDVNPYGIVFVPASVGKLHAGDLLVSNFNDKANNQGTGTTIVESTTGGKKTLFAQISAHDLPGSCPGGVGLTTALSVLPGGYVVVGSLPTTNGKSATAQYGCLTCSTAMGDR